MPPVSRSGGPQPAVVALAALGGLALGVLGSFLQAIALLGLPLGTPLVLAGTGLAFVGAGSAGRSRGVAAACAAGWALAVVVMITPRAAGDIVLTAEPTTYVFLAGGLLLGAVASSIPYGSARRADTVVPNAAADGRGNAHEE